jgi:hypothetical protein
MPAGRSMGRGGAELDLQARGTRLGDEGMGEESARRRCRIWRLGRQRPPDRGDRPSAAAGLGGSWTHWSRRVAVHSLGVN